MPAATAERAWTPWQGPVAAEALRSCEEGTVRVGLSRSARGVEFFDRVTNLADDRFELLRGQFRRYRFDDALGQLRNLILHVEP